MYDFFSLFVCSPSRLKSKNYMKSVSISLCDKIHIRWQVLDLKGSQSTYIYLDSGQKNWSCNSCQTEIKLMELDLPNQRTLYYCNFISWLFSGFLLLWLWYKVKKKLAKNKIRHFFLIYAALNSPRSSKKFVTNTYNIFICHEGYEIERNENFENDLRLYANFELQ